MRNSKITICDYLAEQSPKASYEVLMDSGLDFPKPRNKKELAAMLKKFVAIDREIALKSLARIHPDRELIESCDREVRDADFEIKQVADKYGRSKKPTFGMAGCSCGFEGGCSCKNCNNCSCQKSNFDGEKPKDYMPLLVAIGVFGLLYLVIDKK